MNTNCLIVDDEPLAIKLIENHLSKFNSFKIKGTCRTGMEAFEYLRNETIDLMFLDINLPELNGLDFIRSLKDPPKIILTTAYREYAVESFELDVLDYLLKPITFERFIKAIDRFSSIPLNQTDLERKPLDEEYIIVKSGSHNSRIFLKDILFVESFKDYINIQTHKTRYTVKYQIGAFEKRLKNGSFSRIHKSFIINKEHIISFNKKNLVIEDYEIPVGVSYKSEVVKLLDNLKRRSK
ncbi:LytR/AlgR family response regulator transcription factor [Zunongwangia sp. HRR-M8]|uniref:LytR/AlgR family response regulator transcription factor n=1 Tax=Zunongwangia sp. HRR-M8 TaxID=3015170 RepID=UPI0022DD4626|nr:response regulator transcription factor [Zunongwangia sp. HRR-M8]WBL22307.1 response regulator transcription factor [Zunongwangia sp. HRR-M8]